jgi:integrase
MSATLLSEDGEARLARLAWRDLQRYIAKYPQLELTRASEIAKYLRELAVGPRGRDDVRDAIVQLFRFARRHRYLGEDRISEAEKVAKIKAWNDVETWTPQEAALILAHTSARWIPWMALGMFAGLRPSEILRLDWSMIKFDQGVIAVPRRMARKVRTSRLVPIERNLMAWLGPYRELSGPVYPGNFKTNENAKTREIKRITKETGIECRSNTNRHSFGSYRLAMVRSFDQVSIEMGNSPRKVREDYNDPKPRCEGEQYFSITPPDASKIVHLPAKSVS